jgi:hypothetical protein
VAKADWTRKLSEPIDLGGRRPLRTLADVRKHLMSLPAERQHWPAVQAVARLLLEAAEGKDVGDITVLMRIARQAFLIN